MTRRLMTHQIIPFDMKGCICHFTKWQIHPFISKGRNDTSIPNGQRPYNINILLHSYCTSVSVDSSVSTFIQRPLRATLDNDWHHHPRNTRVSTNVDIMLASPSTTLENHYINIGSFSGKSWHITVKVDRPLSRSIDFHVCIIYPSKHETLSQCWLNVGPASHTVALH